MSATTRLWKLPCGDGEQETQWRSVEFMSRSADAGRVRPVWRPNIARADLLLDIVKAPVRKATRSCSARPSRRSSPKKRRSTRGWALCMTRSRIASADGWFAQVLVPLGGRELAGDDGGAAGVAIFDDLDRWRSASSAGAERQSSMTGTSILARRARSSDSSPGWTMAGSRARGSAMDRPVCRREAWDSDERVWSHREPGRVSAGGDAHSWRWTRRAGPVVALAHRRVREHLELLRDRPDDPLFVLTLHSPLDCSAAIYRDPVRRRPPVAAFDSRTEFASTAPLTFETDQ